MASLTTGLEESQPEGKSVRKLTRGSRTGNQSLVYIILIIGAVLALVPFFWMISTSLMTLGETINRKWLPAVPQVANYIQAWNEAKFARYFWNSVIITGVTLIGLLITSILAGYAFGRINFKGRNAIFAILLSTMMIPETITWLPNLMLVRGTIIPLTGGSWLNSLQALAVPFMANAFSIFLLKQFFAQIHGAGRSARHGPCHGTRGGGAGHAAPDRRNRRAASSRG